MSPPSQLLVNVADLLEQPGSLKHVRFEEWVEGLENDLVRIEPQNPLKFDLNLESIAEGAVLVRGEVKVDYTVTCRRCLDEMPLPHAVQMAEVYRPRGGDVWEEGYVIENETIDLHPAVRDSVVLNMPLYPLCREDCKGLCPRCGANLNRGPCSCPSEDADDRWGTLRELLPKRDA